MSKRYGLVANLLPSTKGRWALRDISFDLRRGEALGLIGRNGSGKSTLLRVIAGVTPPSQGAVSISGSLFPMIELNAGTHPELTGRENVQLLGAVMGLGRRTVARKMSSIEEFCELGDWFDVPIRQYSSGMLARLGFGVALNTDADILLVDEVLAVGDLAFQKKCLGQLENVASEKTILFVSHSLRQVQRFCTKVLVLDEGRQVFFGDSPRGVNLYEELIAHNVPQPLARQLQARQTTSGEVEIEAVELLDSAWVRTQRLETGAGANIRVRYNTHVDLEGAVLGVFFVSSDQMVVAGMTNEGEHRRARLNGKGSVTLHLESVPFLPGRYTIKLRVVSARGRIVYSGHDLCSFEVLLTDPDVPNTQPAGVVRLQGWWL